jgi:3-hydroxymyristoyl/3-hydroxydecanoyl-(acyl carrier protein) dehydratase
VPGVVLLDKVLECIEAKVNDSAIGGETITIPAVKFLQPVLPGHAVILELAINGGKIGFECSVNGDLVASGTIKVSLESPA